RSFLFPPQDKRLFHSRLLEEIVQQRVRKRPHRHYPRAIKRCNSPFAVLSKDVRAQRSFTEEVIPEICLS
ncbi:MAG TPA: hypothetical protein VEK57_30105, partial [Thermoanaerobaculia bacterium]|nr:hypothetical protein [Thermoanaerobaculia bacterium]HYI13339.1 hypothetical protein [Thermoanaerobaculia bacterium]